MSWFDLNSADEQSNSDVIPHKTPVKVRMKIRPGSYDDPSQGWTGGYATRSQGSVAVYLDCEFTIIGGKFNKRKVWSNVGLYSSKGPKWGEMGRAFMRAAVESARGIRPSDASEQAIQARRISGFADLDGLEFAAFVDVQKPTQEQIAQGYGDDRNVIQNVIPATHKDYAALMAGQGGSEPAATAPTPTASKPAGNMPAWAT